METINFESEKSTKPDSKKIPEVMILTCERCHQVFRSRVPLKICKNCSNKPK